MLFERCMFWKKIHQFIQASTVQDCIPNCFCTRIKFKLAVIVKPHFLPFFLRNVMSVKVGHDFLFIFFWTPWIIWFHSLCLQDHQLAQKLTSFFLLRKLWWTTLCRWSPTLLTLVTLWCWWRDGSSKGRAATLLLLPDLRRNASWFATCFLQRTWVHVSTAVFGCSANPAAFWFVIPLIRGLVAAPAPAHYTHLKRLAFGWKTHKWTHSWRPSNNIFHSAQNHISDWMSCLSRRALSAWPRFLHQTATEFPWMQNWPGCCPSFPLLARLNRTDSFFFNTNYLWDSEAMRLQCLLIAFLILTLFLLLVG